MVNSTGQTIQKEYGWKEMQRENFYLGNKP